MAKQLNMIEKYTKMNSTYNQLVKFKYLKMKQMITHLNEVIDFTTNNNLSFVDALIKLTAYEIDYKEQL